MTHTILPGTLQMSCLGKLVTGYLWLLAERRAKLEDLVRKLVGAVDKIEAVQKEVEKMRKVLVVDSLPITITPSLLLPAVERQLAKPVRRGEACRS